MKLGKLLMSSGLMIAAPLAFAQSSITLYGVADVGIEYVTHVPNASGGGASNAVRMQSGNLGGSHFGFRGTEDLGGGLHAIFVLESGYSINNGTLTQGGRLFGRQAFVGLSDDTWGTVTVGRHKNFLFEYGIAYDALTYDPGYSPYAFDTQLGNRADNSIKYAFKRNGVILAALYSTGFDATIANGFQVPGATKVGREYEFAALYQGSSPLHGGVIFDQIQGTSIATQSAAQQRVLAVASYIFGRTKLYAAYRWLNGRNQVSALSSNLVWAGVTYQVNVPLFLTAEVYHTQFRDTHNGPTAVSVLAHYFVSKRTSVYLAAAYVGNAAGMNQSLRGTTTDIATGANQTGVMMGVRQVF